MLRIRTYRDAKGEYRWSALDGNNRIVADGAEGYTTAQGLKVAVINVVDEFTRGVTFTPIKGRTVDAKSAAMRRDRKR